MPPLRAILIENAPPSGLFPSPRPPLSNRGAEQVLASVTIIMTINWRLALVSLIVAPVLASITRLVTSRSASVAVELQAAAGV
jgi:ABC-type multidrug transport system fused ATPase/permease subunit